MLNSTCIAQVCMHSYDIPSAVSTMLPENFFTYPSPQPQEDKPQCWFFGTASWLLEQHWQLLVQAHASPHLEAHWIVT
jgi:hypothetical protein